MPDTHARLSASGAKKWSNCSGSIQMEEQFPETTSEFAEEGTKAHAIGELKILYKTENINAAGYGKKMAEFGTIPGDMAEYTDEYRDFVIERYNEAMRTTPDAQLLVEKKVDLSEWVPNGFGTCDAVIIADKVLEIIDLKYGMGVKVSAENNPQLRLYALGALSAVDFLYDIETVRTTIYQPRIDNISSEELSVEDLRSWGQWIAERAALAADDNITECNAGDHCDSGFCKARAVCRAYADKRLELARYEFRRPSQLTPDEVADIIQQSDKLAKWAKLVSDYALDEAVNHGTVFPGYKLVEGRSNRKYCKTESEIESILTKNGFKSDDIYTKSLKGIGDMEKLLGKTQFAKLLKDCVVKPQGKPTLVPIDDKREAIGSANSAADDFKNLIEK